MPGPCRPIEFSMPLGVSAIRGVGRPDRGRSMIDLVTTAPSSATSKNWPSSLPAAAHPDAVRIGFGSCSDASEVAEHPSVPHSVRAVQVGRQRADVGPAHPAGVEHRPLHAGPDEPRHPVVADAPAARRSCTPRCRRPSTPRPRPGPGWRAPGRPRRPRAASASARRRRRPAAPSRSIAEGSGSVTRPRWPAEPSSVVTVTLPISRLAASSPNSRPAVAAPRIMVDLAAQGQQPLGQRQQRRRAVAAADQHRRHRLARDRERHAERADQVELGPDRLADQPLGAAAVRRRPRTGSVPANSVPGFTPYSAKDRRSSIEMSGPPTATATNWPGLEGPGHPGRHHGELGVVAEPGHVEDLAGLLHRRQRRPRCVIGPPATRPGPGDGPAAR